MLLVNAAAETLVCIAISKFSDKFDIGKQIDHGCQVHRQLLAALKRDTPVNQGPEDTPGLPGTKQLQEMAEHMNIKHRVRYLNTVTYNCMISD